MKNELQEFITTIKRELLQKIILHLNHAELSSEKAQEIARQFLQGPVPQTKEDVLTKLKAITEEYASARDIYLKYAKPYYEEHRGCLITNIRAAIEQGDMENAVSKAYWRCGV